MPTKPHANCSRICPPVAGVFLTLITVGHANAGLIRNLVEVRAIGSGPSTITGVSGRIPKPATTLRDDVGGTPLPPDAMDLRPAKAFTTSPGGNNRFGRFGVTGDPFSPSDDLPPAFTQFGLFPALDSGLGHAAGIADSGELHAWAGAASAYLPTGGSRFPHVNASVEAHFVIDDLVFEAQAGGEPLPPGPFSASLNLEVTADIIPVLNYIDTIQRGVTTVSLTGNVGGLSFTALDSIHQVSSFGQPPVLDLQHYRRFGIAGVSDREIFRSSTLPLNQGLFPLLEELPANRLTTDGFAATLNQPIPLSLTLKTFAEIQPIRRAIVVTDVAHSVTFPTSGPVFNLPSGVTVNSAQANIVDNRWLGGTQTTPVPEPSNFALLAIGAGGLLAYGRRWRGGNGP